MARLAETLLFSECLDLTTHMPKSPRKNPAPSAPVVDSPLRDLFADSVYKWFTDWLGLWSFLRQRKQILAKPEILCTPDYPGSKDKTAYQFLIQALVLIVLLSSIVPFTLRIIGTPKPEPTGRSAWDLETEARDLGRDLKSADAFDSVELRDQLQRSRKDAHYARFDELSTRFRNGVEFVCFPLGVILSAYFFRLLVGSRAKAASHSGPRAHLIYLYLTPAILFWAIVADSVFNSATDAARQLDVPVGVSKVLDTAFWVDFFGMPLIYLLLLLRMSKVVGGLFGFRKARGRLGSIVGAGRALVTVIVSWLAGYLFGLGLAISIMVGIAYITEAIDRWKLG